MYEWLRRLFFCLPPELAHKVALNSLQALAYLPIANQQPHALSCKVMGLTFANPVGIAAGLDKNACYLRGLGQLGVGFIEVGSVTLQARTGNPLPRIFRIPQQQALINRLGLPNEGIDAILPRLQQHDFSGILGVNIAKDAGVEEASAVLAAYQTAYTRVYPYADYVTVNLSCPHEPGLRELQFGRDLQQLLGGLKEVQTRLTHQHNRYVPLVVKLSPEISADELAAICEQLVIYHIDGVIATNTTNQRPLVQGLQYADERGGLSGKPLFIAATETLRVLHQHLQHKIPIIAVGGIMNGDDALQKFKAGARLVQVYTGLIYRGPGLIRDIIETVTPHYDMELRRVKLQ